MPEIVINDEHMAMPTGAAIAADPTLSVANVPAAAPTEEYTPPPGNSSIVEAANAMDMPTDVREAVMSWLEHGSPQSQEELGAIDAASRVETQAELRQLWGDKYDEKVQAINKYLDGLPSGIGDLLRNARGPDGRAFANDPAVLVRIAGVASKDRPALTAGNVDVQVKEIESFMRSHRTAYNRDEALQAHYRELLAMKHGARP